MPTFSVNSFTSFVKWPCAAHYCWLWMGYQGMSKHFDTPFAPMFLGQVAGGGIGKCRGLILPLCDSSSLTRPMVGTFGAKSFKEKRR